MTLDELTPWLFARASGGVRWGLERTEEVLAGVGDPHRLFHSVLIGGTNGKGSVAALADSALRIQGGRKIGLYTSPHLVSFTERIRIDGRPIDAARLADLAARLRPAIEDTGASFFEATTAIAFLAFAEADVELAVVEVGLGGRLDSTNVLDPLVTAVTNVSMDHAEYLGDSVEEVAFEKAGIFKRGVPALVGEEDSRLTAILEARAAAVGAPFQRLDDITTVSDVRTVPTGTVFTADSRAWGRRGLRLPLIGAYQARNAAMASEILGLLPARLRPHWPAIVAGFDRVRWPGRMQIEKVGETTFVLDVAHNVAGAASLSETIGKLELVRPIAAVVGILRDKDWRAMLSAIAEQVDALVLTTPDSAPVGRRWDVEEAGRWCAANLRVSAIVAPDLGPSIHRAVRMAPRGTVVVTGSVHTVGDAMIVLGISTGVQEYMSTGVHEYRST